MQRCCRPQPLSNASRARYLCIAVNAPAGDPSAPPSTALSIEQTMPGVSVAKTLCDVGTYEECRSEGRSSQRWPVAVGASVGRPDGVEGIPDGALVGYCEGAPLGSPEGHAPPMSRTYPIKTLPSSLPRTSATAMRRASTKAEPARTVASTLQKPCVMGTAISPAVGVAVGILVGLVGRDEGIVDGSLLDGQLVGRSVGSPVGAPVGSSEGADVGSPVGSVDGEPVGSPVGWPVGSPEG